MRLMTLAALLLDPIAGQFGGGGGPASPSPASPASSAPPAQSAAPSPGPNSPERGSVQSQASNNGGERNFELPENFGQSNGQVQAQPQAQGQTQLHGRQNLPTPTDPNQAAASSVPQNFQSIRDAAAELGFNFGPNVTDDRSALTALIHQAQANNYYAQMGQRLAPHAQGFQQYLQNQQQPQVQAPTRQPWEAPQFDQRWLNLVVEDERTGLYLSRPGVDPQIGQAVNEYVEWKRNFDHNPASVINGMVEERARTVASEVFQSQWAAQQQRQAAEQIVQANSEWFYARDNTGQYVRDFQGRPQPSPQGTVYLRHLGNVRNAGVTNPVQQDLLARQLMAGEYAQNNARQAAQQSQSQGFPAQQATYSTSTNPIQTLPPQQRQSNPGFVPQGEEGLSLMERLQRNFAAANIQDSDFSPENFG